MPEYVRAVAPYTAYNLPAGAEVQVHTDAELEIAFWNPLTKAYNASSTIEVPGQFLGVGSAQALITGTGASFIIID